MVCLLSLYGNLRNSTLVTTITALVTSVSEPWVTFPSVARGIAGSPGTGANSLAEAKEWFIFVFALLGSPGSEQPIGITSPSFHGVPALSISVRLEPAGGIKASSWSPSWLVAASSSRAAGRRLSSKAPADRVDPVGRVAVADRAAQAQGRLPLRPIRSSLAR